MIWISLVSMLAAAGFLLPTKAAVAGSSQVAALFRNPPREYSSGPHTKSDSAAATRLATGFSQPLIATQAAGSPQSAVPRLRLSNDEVVVIALKPSDDGKAWIVRPFGASGNDATVKLAWGKPEPKEL
jgi:alpha-mannosidase